MRVLPERRGIHGLDEAALSSVDVVFALNAAGGFDGDAAAGDVEAAVF